MINIGVVAKWRRLFSIRHGGAGWRAGVAAARYPAGAEISGAIEIRKWRYQTKAFS